MTTDRRRRTRRVTLLTFLAMLVTGLAAAAPASADFVCTTGTIYGLNESNGALAQIDTASGNSTPVGTLSSGASANGLAIPPGGGRYAYAVGNATAPGQIYRFDSQTGATDVFPGVPRASHTMGAINPANGFYYFTEPVGGDIGLFGFNTITNTFIGQVGTITGGAGTNGDIAFDALGNLYVVRDLELRRVSGPIPTGPGNTNLPSTLLTGLPAVSNGIAFDGDGTLYIGSGANYVGVDPTTGAQLRSFTSFGATDLASCATPPTIRAQKELPDGRIVGSDQFTLTITGGGITQGNTGTTEGTDGGLQNTPPEMAGPVLARTGVTYTVTEAGTPGTNLAAYTTTWQCVNTSAGGAEVASGTGPSGQFTMPASQGNDILCTFRNAAPPAPVPGIALDKQAGALVDTDGNGGDAGDTITYTFVVTNTGNVPLDPVSVSDPKVGPVSCPAGPVGPGASVTCGPVTYTVTQADVDAGAANNTATATGTPPPGIPPVTTPPDQTTTPLPPQPGIALDKQAGALVDTDGNGADAGDTIAFTFVVTNTGNVPLNPVSVSDDKVGPVSCPAGPVGPGGSVTCGPVTYTVTQADMNAGAVNNTATATGTPPPGIPPVTSPPDQTSTPLPPVPGIALDKQAGALVDTDGNGEDAGDTITYTFLVTNTGNVTLDPVSVSDPKVGPVSCPAGAVDPGASVTCGPVTYAVTQADVDAGAANNTATATGQPPPGSPPVTTPPDPTTTPLPPRPGIALDKQAGALVDTDGNGEDAGDTIEYTFIVTNTGNVTLDPVSVSDPKVGPVSCPAGPVAPGASVTCGPVVYTVTQADADAGAVNNTAVATGTPPPGIPPIDSPPDSTSTPIPPDPSIDLDKQAGAIVDVDGDEVANAGDTIEYTFIVTNTGNVTLNPVTVTDPMVGEITCPDGPLAPEANVTCTAAPYVLTQADIDAPSVDNTATATGTPPVGPPVTDDDGTSTPTPDVPGIELDKEAGEVVDADGNGVVNAGDTIEFTFAVTNTGNVTLDPVTVSDPKVGEVTCPDAPLAPDETVSCDPVVYTITQADVDGPAVDNIATAEGTPPDGPPVSDEDPTTTPTPDKPAIDLDKQAGAVADTDGNGHDEGDTITYTFLVTNTGNVTLDEVTVSDPKVGAVSCPPGPLAPGKTVSCGPVAYTVTQADIDAAEVVNTATATGRPPDGPPVSDEDNTKTPTPVPRVTLDKQAGTLVDIDDNGPDKGDTIEYTFVVTNVGNVRLVGLKISDTKVRAIACPKDVLERGESMTCTAPPYRISDREARRGRVVNTATVDGHDDTGTPVKDPGEVESTFKARIPKLRLSKTADRRTVRGGELVSFRIRVRNQGPGSARRVKVCDRLPSGLVYVSSTPKARVSGRQHCWTIKRLAEGKSRTFQVTVRVANGATGRKTNTATLTSPDITKRLRAPARIRVRGEATPLTG